MTRSGCARNLAASFSGTSAAPRRSPPLEDDNLSILDLENIILTGQVTERQRDGQTREVKCVVAGIALDGSAAEAVVKIGFTGKLIVITVYLS